MTLGGMFLIESKWRSLVVRYYVACVGKVDQIGLPGLADRENFEITPVLSSYSTEETQETDKLRQMTVNMFMIFVQPNSASL